MNKSVFLYNNYRKLIEEYVEAKKSKGFRYSYQKLAESLQLQKSYLSKVLKGDADLNSDQVYLLSNLLELDEEEEAYLLLLLEKERTALVKRKSAIKRKIKSIQNKKIQTEIAINKIENEETNYDNYYLNVWNQLIHMALTISDYSNYPKKLLAVLNISENLLEKVLVELERSGIIKWVGTKIIVVKDIIHLNRDSPLFIPWRSQLLNLCQSKTQSIDQEGSYNFSVVFTCCEEDRDTLQIMFLDYLNKVQKVILPAESKKLYAMNFDLTPFG